MRLHILHGLPAVLLGLLPLPSEAQAQQNLPPPAANAEEPAIPDAKDGRGHAKASAVIGSEVHSLEKGKLGHVHDIAVVLETGRIVQIALAFGGIRGVEDRLTAVPPEILQISTHNNYTRLKAEVDKFRSAPRFEMARWEEAVKPDAVAAVYQHYGQEFKPFSPPGTGSGAAAPGHAVVRGSRLIGAPIRNLQDEKIGKVEDLLLDLRRGHIAAVIVSSGEFLGFGGDLSAIPAAVLRYNKQQDTLLIDATREVLTQAPHFDPANWPDLSGSSEARIGHPFRRAAAPSAQPAKAGEKPEGGKAAPLSPLDQGSSAADIRMTASIRKALVAHETLSVGGKNIMIVTRNGEVTLQGSVADAAEKKTIESIAIGLAGKAKVTSRLEVE